MKVKILLFLFAASLLAQSLFAQNTIPQGFSYQAVVRDAGGAVLANKPVVFYFDVREGTPQGSAVYSESQEASTNEFGLVNLYVGQGKPVGAARFSNVDWAASSKFLTISLDSGTGLITNLGTSQLMSVPYALYAAKSGESIDAVTVTTEAGGQITGAFCNLQIAQQGAYVGQVLKWDGAKWTPGEDEKTKETGGPEGPSTVPVGAILPWAGPASTVPTGWLLCTGQQLPRAGIYAALFAVIGVSWGQGNGTTTFTIPDLRGQFLRGANLSNGQDPNAAQRKVQTVGVGLDPREAGSKQDDAFQGHAHILSSANSSYDVQSGIRIRNSSGSSTKLGLTAASGVNDNMIAKVLGAISDGSNGTPRTSSETRPKNVNVNYIIKW